VAIDRPIANVETDAVTVDNLEASFGATRHLIEHGHRDIICVADDERIYTKNQRVLGYSKAMREAHLIVRVCTVGPMTGTVADQMPFFMESHPAPTALFAASNHVGIDVLHFFRQCGIRMPKDVAFVCFDDFSAATLVTPTITVVQQPVTEIGRKGAQIMLGRLKEASRKEPVKVILATKFVVRKSCGC
jgi:DNA-binding LacI/PurR family transcriptional regulator